MTTQQQSFCNHLRRFIAVKKGDARIKDSEILSVFNRFTIQEKPKPTYDQDGIGNKQIN